MSSNTAVLEALADRVQHEKLFFEYREPFDHSKKFGPKNIGPYDWQVQVHNAGAEYTERLLVAANRVGKTRCAGAEVACHATGLYPKWWQGKRYENSTTIWCGSESWTASRDIVQDALLGPVGEFGTGWIPKDLIVDTKKRQAGVSDVIDSIKVKHKSGKLSVITLKSYEQQRKEWQGRACDFVWFDEEPPLDIYNEGLTRLLDKRGSMLVTFTPLKGPTEVVRHFMNPPDGASTFMKNVGWDDAPHLDEKAREEMRASYPEHERETRSQGTPLLGSGAIFPIYDGQISVDPFKIPDHYALINGIDFGIDHPGACAYCAWDRDSDTFYVYDCYKKSGETPIYHAAAINKYGTVATAWPHDGYQRDKGNATALKNQFRQHGVHMLKEHAHYQDERQNSVEAGLQEMYEYMRTNRFKVFSILSDWFEEKRLYHREDGRVVAKHDDIMCATRYAFVMRRYARPKLAPVVVQKRPTRPIVGGNQWKK